MHRGLIFALTALTLAPAALAQGGADAAGPQTSWFRTFFLSEGDLVGLAIVWLLLLMSALCIGYTIKLAMQFRRATMIPEETRAELEALIAQKKYRDAIEYARHDPSYLGKLAGSALSEAGNGYPAMERAIEEAGDVETTRYLRPVEYLNVAGNIAPMLGLFGTVYGMIAAFQKLVATGGNPDPAQLAAGISTALVTTFWGLVVAIPALAAYALIRNKIDALTSEGMVAAEEIIRTFKPSAQRVGPSPTEAAVPSSTPRPRAAEGE